MTKKYELGAKMRTGAFWVYLQGGLNSVIQFIAGIVLARILDPSDFGVFYAVTAYTSLLMLQTSFGLPPSLIQAKDVTAAQWNSAFWFMQGIALLCIMTIFVLSNWLQGFYDDDRFTIIMWFMAITLILSPFSTITGTMLRRKLDYKTTSRVQIIVGLFAVFISISFAIAGFGPFSLVISGIISGILSAILLARKTSWQPNFSFDIRGLGSILSYGWRLHLNRSLNMGANKADNILVGSMAGTSALGFYNRALSTARMPVQEISARLYQLFFSGLARIQNDREHTIQMYKKVLCAMTNAVYPFLLVFIFAGESFIYFIYGEKWLPAVEPLQILALGSMARVISITMGALADAQGLASKETPIQVINLLLTITVVWAGSSWGLTGIAIGIAFKTVFLMLMMEFMLSRSHMNLNWSVIREGISPAIAGSTVASVLALVTINILEKNHLPPGILSLIIITSIIFLSYGATLIAHSRLFPKNKALAANIEMFQESLLKLHKKIRNY